MNFLFFGGWLCAVVALLIAVVLIGVALLESFDAEGRPLIRRLYLDRALVTAITVGLLALLVYVVAGSIALWKGWFF
jgi:hypothetical protein